MRNHTHLTAGREQCIFMHSHYARNHADNWRIKKNNQKKPTTSKNRRNCSTIRAVI